MCYGASLRGDSPSLVQLKATTEDPVGLWIVHPPAWMYSGHSETVDTSFTVRELKERLSQKYGTPVSSIELKFSREEKHMEDNQTMAEVGVVPMNGDIYVSLI